MRKRFNVGDCRTRIIIKAMTPGMDADDYPTETWTPLFAEAVPCQWVNAHGVESKSSISGGKYTLSAVAADHNIAVIF